MEEIQAHDCAMLGDLEKSSNPSRRLRFHKKRGGRGRAIGIRNAADKAQPQEPAQPSTTSQVGPVARPAAEPAPEFAARLAQQPVEQHPNGQLAHASQVVLDVQRAAQPSAPGSAMELTVATRRAVQPAGEAQTAKQEDSSFPAKAQPAAEHALHDVCAVRGWKRPSSQSTHCVRPT